MWRIVNSTLKCNFTDDGKVRCGSILIFANQYKELPYETLHAPHRDQRYQIANGLRQGYSQQIIADIVGVNKSTISREIRRNGASRGRVRRRPVRAGDYRPIGAHKQAMARRASKARVRIGGADWRLIEWLLQEKWSPEQISLWLGENGRVSVSHEWIYRYIRKDKYHGGCLYKHLRCRKRWKKRYGSKARRGSIPNRVSIEQRPAVVGQRVRIGDWELDTVYGKTIRPPC